MLDEAVGALPVPAVPSIPIGPRDVFIATFWPTALFAIEARGWQATTFGAAPPAVAYLIQDFEPGFYARSAQSLLSNSTYDTPSSTIAIFNSSLLQREFHDIGLRFASEFSFEPRLAPALRDVFDMPPVERSRTIVVYGRPSKPRNAFGLIVDGLRTWRATTPDAADWRIVSVGESHHDVDLGGGVVLNSLGKLSMEAYAQLLRTSAIGISLMISPHPSYPPLDMSYLGMLVLTNRLARRSCRPGIRTSRPSTRSRPVAWPTISTSCAGASRQTRPRAIEPSRSCLGFLDTGAQFPFAAELATLLERDPASG